MSTEIEKIVAALQSGEYRADDLEARIAYCIGWRRGDTQFYDDGEKEIPFNEWISPDGKHQGFSGSACHSPNNRRYTRSVDDAASLVPDGLGWDVGGSDGQYEAEIWGEWFDATGRKIRDYWRGSGWIEGHGDTPAVALTIAALLARNVRD